MLFAVRRQRRRGVAIPKSERQFVRAVVGDLRIEEQQGAQFGRLVRVATLYSLERQVSPAELPCLYDVQLLWMSQLALVLGGLELEGNAAYAQTWHCVPVLPSLASGTFRGEQPTPMHELEPSAAATSQDAPRTS